MSIKKDGLLNFTDLPDVGNSNANPLKHQQKVQAKGAHKNGKKLSVAILGVPNSGKSTLINRLMGKEVCPASCKHNTTRRSARAILTQEDTQLVFLDTPGVVSPSEATRYRLDDQLVRDPERSCAEADLLIVLQDVSNRFTREAVDKQILRLLCKNQHKVPSILVLNKLDTIPRSRRVYDLIRKLTCNRLEGGSGGEAVKISQHDPKWNVESYLKRKKRLDRLEGEEVASEDKTRMEDILLEAKEGRISSERAEFLVRGLLGWPGFRDVFSISAKLGDGVEDLKLYLLQQAKPGGHRYAPDLILDVDPRDNVINIVKSKLLEHLDHDLPYALTPELELWEYDRGEQVLRISVSIQTKTHRQYASLIGSRGKTVQLIASEVESSLQDFLDLEVKFNLRIIVPEVILGQKTEKTLRPVQKEINFL